MKRRRSVNPKRLVADPPPSNPVLLALAACVSYGGNPEHKRASGDFGLTPPASPRPDKTLCDGAEVFRRSEADSLLREGIRRGLISEQFRGSFPQNVWAVAANGTPVEAQLENQTVGSYHGYPMPETDPFREEILARW